MVEKGCKVTVMSSQEQGNPRSSKDRAEKRKKKKKELQENLKEEQGADGDDPLGWNVDSGKKILKKKALKEMSIDQGGWEIIKVESVSKGKKKRKRPLLEETNVGEEDVENNTGASLKAGDQVAEIGESEEEEQLLRVMTDEEQVINGLSPLEEGIPESIAERAKSLKNKMKKQLVKEAARADKRGVCYLSRIPPHMDYRTLRHMLSKYGEIQRIYLAPKDPSAQVNHKRSQKARRFNVQEFSEGWVEFTNKSVAKRVANMLNGEQVGGRKRSQFYYDLWNIKYLSKFKWDDLTEEIAYKKAVREQKLALEVSAAKRERDFYLAKVDQSHALSAIEERRKKKQSLQQEQETQFSINQQMPKVNRKVPQTKPIADRQRKPQLSKDILAGIFGGF